MSENVENTESAAGNERRKAGTAPGLEGEGGQYVEGDYGDAGTVGTAAEAETDEDRNSWPAFTEGELTLQRP